MEKRSPVFPVFAAAAVLTVFGGCKPAAAPADNTAKVDFNKDIQPVLAERCYHCHGPDSGSRKSGLRLDLAETAFAKRPGKPDAIVPDKPDASELIRRISAHDGAVMPPREAVEKPLNPEQVELFRKWISEGAKYRPHWAFEKPVRAPVPVVTGLVRNPVDAFILAGLATAGLPANPETDKVTLIRRVTLDLTGLLPTPTEVDTFLSDTAPDAYERVVDRLLASTAFGENRARYWLDLARYGDTQGIHNDSQRAIWPYRDYVIRAFNANKPFDRFVREQIAGDMSNPDNIDAIVASGYIRAGVATGEGGTVVDELRANLARERTEAYGAAFLGLTVGCAACHDHKFDPVTQKDFYALTAYFNNIAECPSTRDAANWPPYVKVPKEGKRAAYDATLAQKAEVLRLADSRRREAAKLVMAWIVAGPGVKPVSAEGLKLRLRLDEGKGATLVNSAPEATPRTVVATGSAPVWGEETWLRPALRMEGLTKIAVPEIGDIEKNEPFSAGTWLAPRDVAFLPDSSKVGAIFSRMDSASGQGWELYDDNGYVALNLVSKGAGAIRVKTKNPVLALGRWDHVFATYDGSGAAAGVKIYLNGVAAETVAQTDELKGSIRTKAPFQLGRRSPDAARLLQPRYQDLRFYARALPPEEASRVAHADRVAEVLAKPRGQWDDDETKLVTDYYFANADNTMRGLLAKLPAFDAKLGLLSGDGDITLVCEETPRLAYANVLSRGSYTDRMERVRPAPPHFLPPSPADAPKDRRALAEWTVSPENPLTARVTVNRIWNEIFGTGLVATTDDFGIMGDRPSHPELLDWLAVEFRESGWDMKRMYRLLVISAAYRRDAKATPLIIGRDPGNRLLARGPRRRLDAEVLRDTALQAAGLLSPRIGGPGVKPYQPGGVWEAVSGEGSNTRIYKRDSGESLYRKSLYSYWKRQAILPDMEVFDAPVRDASCTRRARTNTPLQALVTMNDPQWVEAARILAERVLREGGATTDTRLDFLGRTLLGRALTPAERRPLSDALVKLIKAYADNPKDADVLLATGEKPRDPALPAPELAAWTLVASAILNLDKTLNN